MYGGIIKIKKQDAIGDLARYAKEQDGNIFITRSILFIYLDNTPKRSKVEGMNTGNVIFFIFIFILISDNLSYFFFTLYINECQLYLPNCGVIDAIE